MKSEICLNINNAGLCPFKGLNREITIIITQMELMGISPVPFLKIAAQDLLNQYGCNALGYAHEIIKSSRTQGNQQAAQIWTNIAQHLNVSRDKEGPITH